ncbi:SIS domain-containing protein [Rubrobacter indicoceani]|uniref:SIS domain-containing protein n=1 Tax=Rubrobacter indicoceani TaxID=2051957 RepID=UPI000E5B10D3|nr:SIS domain-containing protein [Rubrobacter indicoceani]
MTDSSGYSQTDVKERGAEWTAREISQQPSMWRRTAEILEGRSSEIKSFIQPLMSRRELRIVLAGAGTSAFAGEILAPALTRHLRRRVDAVATTDIVSNPAECFAEDVPTLLVSFARSGNSPESIAATDLAGRYLSECHQLIITCAEDGRLYRDHADAENSLVMLMPPETNDRGFAMTSSFTSMMLTAWAVLGGTEDVTGLAARLSAAAEGMISEDRERTDSLAARGYERVVYIGSGSLKGLAHESSLKLLELTAGHIVTYFESPLGFRHGPKSILNDKTLVVVYLSADPYTRKYDLDLVAEIRNTMSSGSVVVLDTLGTGEHPDTWTIEGLEGLQDVEIALPYVVAAQMIGLSFSLALGYTPDNPFPGGEVNRVVEGVTIYSPVRGA